MKINRKTSCQKAHLRWMLWGAIALIATLGTSLMAQTSVMKVNRVWCGYIENGSVGAFRYGTGWFPADYNCMGPSMESGNSMTGSMITMATTNWTDPNGTMIPKAVIRPVESYSAWSLISPMENSLRYGYPSILVDNTETSLDDWGSVDPTKMVGTSDQTITGTTRNALGVDIQRKVFGWGQQFHNDYIVVDLVLTNNSGTTLDSFYVSMHEAPFYWRKAKGSAPGVPDQDDVDRSMAWHHYYGARPGDSLRVWYMYHADDPRRDGDQMGGPVASQDGRLMETDITFYTILHASQEPYTDPANDVDDPLQPRITDVYAESPQGVQGLWGGDDATGRDLIYDLTAGKHGVEQPMSEQYDGTFHRANNDEQGDPDYNNLGDGFSLSSIWNRSISAFGPYTFEDGESIHIVYASGYSGIGIEKEKELGGQWLRGTITDAPNLPDARTGYFPSNFAYPPSATERDKIKDRWISTGIDSVMKAASRAKWNFQNNWQVPPTPPPPVYSVSGLGDGVELVWSNPEAEALPGFDGYRIMRRISRQDTIFFDEVYRSAASDKAAEHVWKDTDVLSGANYYYYVQAGIKIDANDVNAYPTSRGKTIWSNRLLAPTNIPLVPPKPSQDDLSKIRVVPNPYNINDPILNDYGLDQNLLISFYNLPAVVTIKIFTESGDLIRTIDHRPFNETGSSDWNMLTDSQQAISSGVYIAVFEKPNGEISYQKFVVIR